jgi:2-dehydro-3-deoxygalactonokinase
MLELPYAKAPIRADGGGLVTRLLGASARLPHDLLLISGVRSGQEAMRGEETQAIGVLGGLPAGQRSRLILVGTHSKHVLADGSRAREIRTFMTGEFFEVLSRHSILSRSVKQGKRAAAARDFAEGVRAGARDGILSASFQVRMRNLLGGRTAASGAAFLSGVLIGAELAALPKRPRRVHVVGDPALTSLYASALRVLGGGRAVREHSALDATVAGQLIIARAAGLLPAP